MVLTRFDVDGIELDHCYRAANIGLRLVYAFLRRRKCVTCNGVISQSKTDRQTDRQTDLALFARNVATSDSLK